MISVRLPYRSPNLNAYAERFVRSIKDECLNRMIFFGERSLRTATREYAAHYHRERKHQGIDNRLIEPTDRAESGASSSLGFVNWRQRLRFFWWAGTRDMSWRTWVEAFVLGTLVVLLILVLRWWRG